MMKCVVFLCVLSWFPVDASETLSPRSVNTKYGALRGIVRHFNSAASSASSPGSSESTKSSSFNRASSESSNLGSVEVFLGVPYATPPIGSLRFMPPVTPTHWRGVKLANRFGPVCPQRIPDTSVGMSPLINPRNSTHEKGKEKTNVPSGSSGSSGSPSQSTSSSDDLPEGRLNNLQRYMPFIRNQSEDCLYLNIYVPFGANGPSPSSAKLPVIVFIHGETYDWGTGNAYDGTILASFGSIILVTLNYRLGVFGFLPAVLDGSIRGNYGLMDQVAALHWIQENIGDFGGDPLNVTIMGHGYGAACVNLLMISPMAANLFSRVILMSGSALSPWAMATDSELYARHLAKLLECPVHENVMMVNCIRGKSAEQILRVDIKVPKYLTAFGPIVDGIVVPSMPIEMIGKSLAQNTPHSYAFAPSSSSSSKKPSKYYMDHSDHDSDNGESRFPAGSSSPGSSYDLLFGITRIEAPFLFTGHEERHGIDISKRDRILRTLIRNLFDYHQQVLFLTLINEYTDWNRPVEHPINLLDSLVDILGDALVVSPLIQIGDSNARQSNAQSWNLSGRRHHHLYSSTHQSSSASASSRSETQSTSASSSTSSHPSPKTFFYVYSYLSEHSSFSQRSGCQHGDELPFIFGAPFFSELVSRPALTLFHSNYTRQEAALSEAVISYWVNFAKFGDPNIWPHEMNPSSNKAKERFENVYWPQYDSVQKKYLMIGMKPKVRDHYHSHRLSYWLHLVPRLQATSPNEEPIYYFKHHLLVDHENPDSYDGVVRQIAAFRFQSSSASASKDFVRTNRNHSQVSGDAQKSTGNSNKTASNFTSDRRSEWQRNQLQARNASKIHSSGIAMIGRDISADELSGDGRHDQDRSKQEKSLVSTNNTQATPIIMERSSYSTWLSVTIAIGGSLLVLNILIFAGVYYQLNKSKTASAVELEDDRNGHNDNHTHLHSHSHHSDYSNQFTEETEQLKDETNLLHAHDTFLIHEYSGQDSISNRNGCSDPHLLLVDKQESDLMSQNMDSRGPKVQYIITGQQVYSGEELHVANPSEVKKDYQNNLGDCNSDLAGFGVGCGYKLDQQGSHASPYGTSIRKMPRSVLKKSNVEEPVLKVVHYSPSHSGRSSSCCENECLKKSSSTVTGSGLVNLAPYATLTRNHQQAHYHHQVMFTDSEFSGKQNSLLNPCEEESAA